MKKLTNEQKQIIANFQAIEDKFFKAIKARMQDLSKDKALLLKTQKELKNAFNKKNISK